MKQVCPIFRREFLGYFRSPVAYVFLIVFLIASVGLTFQFGHFYEANSASLISHFLWSPWVFLFLIPAAGMRLWAEEKRTGTVELLFTLPVTTLEAVLGKFFAAWAFLTLAVLMSFPLVLTLGYLGDPDWGPVFTGYVGSILMAGAYLGVCSLTSALTKNQVISFVISVFICFGLLVVGYEPFLVFATAHHVPVWLVNGIANFGFLTHFEPFLKGVVELKDLVFFLSFAGFTLFLNVLALER